MLTHSADLGVVTNEARQPDRLWLRLKYWTQRSEVLASGVCRQIVDSMVPFGVLSSSLGSIRDAHSRDSLTAKAQSKNKTASEVGSAEAKSIERGVVLP